MTGCVNDLLKKWKLLYWNVCGMRNSDKKTAKKMKVVKAFARSYDVICLAETHTTKEMEDEIEDFWGKEEFLFFWNHYRSNSRGIVVMVRRSSVTNEEIEAKEGDGEGRVVSMTVKGFRDKEMKILAMYAPAVKKERRVWMEKVEKEWKNWEGEMVWLADWNFVTDEEMDRKYLRGGKDKEEKGRNSNLNNHQQALGGKLYGPTCHRRRRHDHHFLQKATEVGATPKSCTTHHLLKSKESRDRGGAGVNRKKKAKEGKAKESDVQMMKRWEEVYGVHDVWRARNEEERRWTYTKEEKKMSRLDRVMTSVSMEQSVESVQIHQTGKVSDHNAISITIEGGMSKSSVRLWRLRREVLRDKEFAEKVQKTHDALTASMTESNAADAWERWKGEVKTIAQRIDKRIRKEKNKEERARKNEEEAVKKVENWARNVVAKWGRTRRIGKMVRELRYLLMDSYLSRESKQVLMAINRKQQRKELLKMRDNQNSSNAEVQETREKANCFVAFAMCVKSQAEERRRQIDEEMMRKIEEKVEVEDEEEELRRILYDERSTRQFFAKSKARKGKERIRELRRTEESKATNEEEEMKEIARDFYGDLWKKRKTVQADQSALLKAMKRKSKKESRRRMKAGLTEEEVRQAIKLMARNKTPGIDGLPIEFYQCFEFVVPSLVMVLKNVVKNRHMTYSQRLAVVSILFKKKDRTLLKYYRPISLLCADYKILAKVITERIKPCLKELIHPDQQGFVVDSNIRGNICLVKEVIDYYDSSGGEEALIVLVDGEKAYDRQDHNFMLRLLKHVGFDGFVLDAVRTMYSDVLAKLVLNGNLTSEIPVKGGVRQGCPLSCYLYIIMIESLACKIRANQKISGVVEPNSGQETKISLFADDMAAMVTDVASVRHLRNDMHVFERATGAKVNDDKTFMIALGGMRTNYVRVRHILRRIGIEFRFMSCDKADRYLGDMIGNEVNEETTLESCFKKLDNVKRKWKRIGMTTLGRSFTANSVMLSIFLYRASTNVFSDEAKKRIRRKIEAFIWQRDETKRWRSNVAWEKMVMQKDEGGANVMDVDCAFDATRMQWLRGVLKEEKKGEDPPPWKAWIVRKMKLWKTKWRVKGSVWETRPPKGAKFEKDLAEDCIRVWWLMKDAEGKSAEKGEKKRGRPSLMCDGVEVSGEDMTSKMAYSLLKKKRFGKQEKQNKEMKLKQCCLSNDEREFWFKVRHNWLTLNNTTRHYRPEQSPICPMCKKHVENRRHFMNECPDLLSTMETWAQQLDLPSNANTDELRNYWNLEHPNMTLKQTELVAKLGFARYRLRNRCNAHDYTRDERSEMLKSMWEVSVKRSERIRAGFR